MIPQIKKQDSLLTISIDETSYIEERYLIDHLENNGFFNGSITEVEFKLQHITHINSLCITEIIHIYNRFNEALMGSTVKMALVDLQPQIMNILKLMQISHFLEIRPLT